MSLPQMSFSGAIFIIAIVMTRAVAINKLPKKAFLILWEMVLLRLLIPFSVPSMFSVYTLISNNTSSHTFTGTEAGNMIPVIPRQNQMIAIQGTEQLSQNALSSVSIWLVVWCAGMIFLTVFFSISYLRCLREFQASLPVHNEYVEQWLKERPLKRQISIRQSDRISAPLTYGILRPVILMPKKTDWENVKQLQYVLSHEYVHIYRLDTITKLIATIAFCIHWFNPMVWVMYILFNRDIELACDESVIRHFGEASKSAYARMLIDMETKKGGLLPFCSGFSKNAIEERITAIMKIKKTTIVSLVAAIALVVGTVTVFATSAQADANTGYHAVSDPITVATGTKSKPDEEYISAGLIWKKNMWYYQGKPVAAICDDNGGIYTNDIAADGIYLYIKRDMQSGISEVAELSKAQFLERADQYRNVTTTCEEGVLTSYVNPDDGKTYYSFDGGTTFEPLTDEEFEARYPTPNIEWWTYEEYKAWLENEKVQLQSMIGEKAWTGGRGEFVWTQEIVDETIAMYEDILANIKNGMLYSKTVDGDINLMVGYNPSATDTAYGYQLFVKLDNGDEKFFGPYETTNELLEVVKPFCEEQVKLGNMEQSEADEIISQYATES